MSRYLELRATDHRKSICCLLALEIADYDAKPVFDQVRLTQDFHNLLFDAKVGASSRDLVSVVGEEGALLGFFADAQECFTTALMIREATLTQDRYRDLPLRIGINLGKAEIADDEFGNPYVSGQGKQDADRLMRLGPPRQISVARQFVELLSRSAPELAELLEYQGPCSDTVDPPLCLYRLSPPQSTEAESHLDRPRTMDLPSRVGDSSIQPPTSPAASSQGTAERRSWLRRSWPAYALLLLLVGAALATLSSRFRVEGPAPGAATATPPVTAPAPMALPGPVVHQEITDGAVATPAVPAKDSRKPGAIPSRRAGPTTELAQAAPATAEAAATGFDNRVASEELPAQDPTDEGEQPTEVKPVQDPKSTTLFLAIKPWGEVYVDGRRIGITPPLKSFEVPIGRHVITITNSSLPIYQREVDVEPDAKITVAHDFTCVSTREKICREGFGKGLEFPSRFRFETAETTPYQPSRQ
jgi:class 3 adenylate cyclase